MRQIKKLLPLCLLPLWLVVGCKTTVTNLTPRQMTRNTTGLYPFEVKWSSNQQSLQKDTLKAYVVVGLDSYQMQRVPLVSNRWETLVPIPADKELVQYRYKFDYQYLTIPVRKENSVLSPPYRLQILER